MGKSVALPTFFRRSIGDPVQLSPTPIGDLVQLFRDPYKLHPVLTLLELSATLAELRTCNWGSNWSSNWDSN